MAHWSQAYVGMPYIEGEFTCADLVERVAKDVLGLDVALPRPSDDGTKSLVRAFKAHKDAHAVRTSEPADGHPVLLYGGSGFATHIGVMCDIAGDWFVLHAVERIGAVLQPLGRVRNDPAGGIEGFYQWV